MDSKIQSTTNQQNIPLKPVNLRNWIDDNSEQFQPESDRTLIVRALKGLEEHISISVTHPTYQKTKPEVDDHVGWVFKNPQDAPITTTAGYGQFDCEGCIPDTVNHAKTLREIYEKVVSEPVTYSVPLLWDKKENTIVNNESSEIMRIFNTSFNKFAKNPELDLYPENLRKQIDELFEWINPNIIMGVYKAGFAKDQTSYEAAYEKFFESLERVEEILSKSRYLVGEQVTEIDIKLWVVLIRFDEAYHVYYKLNKKRLIEYPNLLNFTRDIYQLPGIKETVNMRHIKLTYFSSSPLYNPYGIIPIGPNFIAEVEKAHDRTKF